MPFEHYCHCGKWGAFGYGVKLLKGKEGAWFCKEHRPTNVIPIGETREMDRPTRFTAICELCKQDLDTRARGVHQWTAGWVMQRVGGGGHGISLPKRENRWAHRHCVERAVSGGGNQSVFDLS